jgi:hypothetical protein
MDNDDQTSEYNCCRWSNVKLVADDITDKCHRTSI